MNVLINELKTRARLWLTLLQSDNANARKRAQVLCRQHRWDIPDGWQLRHCLNLAAADIGFLIGSMLATCCLVRHKRVTIWEISGMARKSLV